MKTQGDNSGAKPDALALKRAERTFRKGVHTLRSAVSLRGIGRFSRETAVGRALLAWRGELISALGGEAQLSPQRMKLVDATVRTTLILDHIDAFILEQPSIINKSKRSAYPIIAQRTTVADLLSRQLQLLGLDKVPKRLPTLQEYLSKEEPDEQNDPAGNE